MSSQWYFFIKNNSYDNLISFLGRRIENLAIFIPDRVKKFFQTLELLNFFLDILFHPIPCKTRSTAEILNFKTLQGNN